MKKIIAVLLMLVLALSAGCASAETSEAATGAVLPELAPSTAANEPAAVPEPTAVPRLAGLVIGIDPGHQAHANSDRETVSPTSSETKAKVASGTSGRSTGIPEYQTDLEISLKLRDALQALGCTVYMTRETNDVDISNQERAVMMNELNADLVLRIHCDGSTDKSVHGSAMYVRETGDCAQESYDAADVLLNALCEACGSKNRGVHKRDSYTGLNWSTVPSILVELGFMSNAEEDTLLNTPEYQQQLADGLVEGICRYFER